jgi:hypothetical protein
MQFKSRAVPGDETPGIIRVRGDAASSSITTVINEGGVTGGFDPASVAPAQFESEVRIAADGTFTETGTITFGNSKHRLRFSSVTPGWMGPSPVPGLKQGTITWKVDGGEGQLSGASGIITSNFTLDEQGEVFDHHMGVLYIR